MRVIEIVNKAGEGCEYDEEIGNYRVISEGLDDITIIKNYKHKKIKKSNILTLNNNDNLFVIEELENCETYIVKPMDTLSTISKKTGKTIDELINKNNLSTDKLFIGQILKI